jgi:hypothetical protein
METEPQLISTDTQGNHTYVYHGEEIFVHRKRRRKLDPREDRYGWLCTKRAKYKAPFRTHDAALHDAMDMIDGKPEYEPPHVVTKTKNIRKHASYNRDLADDHMICLINASCDRTDGSQREVHLPHVAELKYSRNLLTWLNHNCKGWYAHGDGNGVTSWWFCEGEVYAFHFELSADAITAKLFHG